MYAPLAPIAILTLLAQGAPPAPEPSTGGYLVVPVALDLDLEDHRAFAAVADAVAAFHDGRVVAFDGLDWPAWEAIAERERPDEVLFVVPPEVLDIVLHRRLLLSAIGLDDDPFTDFTFGYFTARDGAALEALWERTRAVHESGLAGKAWRSLGVTAQMKSRVYPGWIPDVAAAAGFEGDSAFVAVVEDDPQHFAFLEEQFPLFEQASVIEINGNGDPEGIWLFSDRRNLDPSRHWSFAPERVGEDPKGEMPRLLAGRLGALELNSPIVWSGTCHSAATGRVFVEGDIVSTFGSTDAHTLYEMPRERSLCLSILDAGAAAYLAPIGANHGLSTSREIQFAIANGSTLGEAVKSTYDDVLLAASGALELTLPDAGKPYGVHEPVMQGGGCNRILIGDPALRPFKATQHPNESVSVTTNESGWEVVVGWGEGWHPWAWDMYGTEPSADWRLVARLPLESLVGVDFADGPLDKSSISVTATGQEGEALPYRLRHAVVESDGDQRWLHLQASGPRGEIERKSVRAVFRLHRAR